MQAPAPADAPGAAACVLPVALVLLVVLVMFGPEAAAGAGLGTQGAWEVVVGGVEAALVWAPYMAAFVITPAGPGAARKAAVWTARGACGWRIVEGLLTAGCRAAFPMTAPPPTGMNLCDRATGWDVSTWSAVAALALVVGLQILVDARGRRHAAR